MEPKVKCPACGKAFNVEEGVEKNDVIYCDYCYAELMVIGVDPYRVEEIPCEDVDEDEDEDEDGEDVEY